MDIDGSNNAFLDFFEILIFDLSRGLITLEDIA